MDADFQVLSAALNAVGVDAHQLLRVAVEQPEDLAQSARSSHIRLVRILELDDVSTLSAEGSEFWADRILRNGPSGSRLDWCDCC